MIYNFRNKSPKIHNSCFVANSADIIGNVIIEEKSSVWFGSVIRADSSYINIGPRTNIQDKCVLHVDENAPIEIKQGVTVGHGAIIHGCKIGKNSLIGMGSIILNNAEIGEFTIIGAGSLVTSGKKIPSGVLCMGSPAKVIRELTEEEKENLKHTSEHYVEYGSVYREECK